jgi:hypothetical protein
MTNLKKEAFKQNSFWQRWQMGWKIKTTCYPSWNYMLLAPTNCSSLHLKTSMFEILEGFMLEIIATAFALKLNLSASILAITESLLHSSKSCSE